MSSELVCCHLCLGGEHDRDRERHRGGQGVRDLEPRMGEERDHDSERHLDLQSSAFSLRNSLTSCSTNCMWCLSSWLIRNSFEPIPPKGCGDGDRRCSWLWLFPPNQRLSIAFGILRSPRLVTWAESVEPRPTVADQWECRCAQPIRYLKALQVLDAAVEIEMSVAVKAKAKVKDELESAMTNFKVMWKKRDLPRSKSFESPWPKRERELTIEK
ncbi:hypothetical protein PIB30_081983, partial [Stylosanthes scabra]|nr:hypothetical protein [Stylosanthes scabra]